MSAWALEQKESCENSALLHSCKNRCFALYYGPVSCFQVNLGHSIIKFKLWLIINTLKVSKQSLDSSQITHLYSFFKLFLIELEEWTRVSKERQWALQMCSMHMDRCAKGFVPCGSSCCNNAFWLWSVLAVPFCFSVNIKCSLSEMLFEVSVWWARRMLLSFYGLWGMGRGRRRNVCAVYLFSCLGRKRGREGGLFGLVWGCLFSSFGFLLYRGIKWEVLGRCAWGQGGQATGKKGICQQKLSNQPV